MTANNNIQFEMVELPSKGECYRTKTSKLPVAYLTASDENIIFSEKLLRDGTMCDVLLDRKVLDKVFNTDDLCIADRQAILLWLRRTGYGDNYTYIDKQGKERQLDLSAITFKDFNLKGDEQGHFEYVVPDGNAVKYRLLTHRDETEISRYVEELDNEIIAGTEMAETEYYCKVARNILLHQIVSVNGTSNIDAWLDGLKYEDFKFLVKYLQEIVPGTTSNNGIELNEELFYNLK